MLKKSFLSLILFFCCFNSVLAKDVRVEIEPRKKVTTSDLKLNEGDEISFVVAQDVYLHSTLYIKKGAPVIGVITSIENNDFLYKAASICAENFKVKDINEKTVKLKGIIYKKGNNHWMITQFIPAPLGAIRGGEVQIKPNKDTFNLFLEDN